MKVGIMSDTHENTDVIDTIIGMEPDVELWIHAGDVNDDARYLTRAVKVPTYFVAGNNDWPDPNVPYTRTIEAAGHRIFLAHGHTFGVRYTLRLLKDAAKAEHCDIAVYGHTHVMDVMPGNDVYVVNPGSADEPRDDDHPSYMTMLLEPGHQPIVHMHRLAGSLW